MAVTPTIGFHTDSFHESLERGVVPEYNSRFAAEDDPRRTREMEHPVADRPKHVPTDREQAFLDRVEDTRHQREIINGLKPFFNEKAPEDMMSFYSEDEVTTLKVLSGTDRDVESRMPVKITRHYFELARTSEPIQRIVKASPDETTDLV